MNQKTLMIGQERMGGDQHKDQRMEVGRHTHDVQIHFENEPWQDLLKLAS